MAWKLAQSPNLDTLYVAPGNAGIAQVATCLDIAADDVDALFSFAQRERIDLTIVGPEAPLIAGLADRFIDAGLPVFGPRREAAQIEGSKAFAKELMVRCGVPTAGSWAFTDAEAAKAQLAKLDPPYVVKADGLAAGKGVIIAESLDVATAAVDDMIGKKVFGEAGEKIVIEEFLDGEEASFLVFTDGTTIVPMVSAQDHKRAYDGDKGPNTGGMGAYSPAPMMTPELEREVIDIAMRPIIDGLSADGAPYCGILYAGLMIKGGTFKILEFNARFGDPETQPILMRLDTDLLEIFDAAAHGRLAEVPVTWSDDAAVCVVMASKGYPATTTKGCEITGIDAAEGYEGVTVFHAGTALDHGKLVTAGGRVLGVTARAEGIAQAIDLVYNAVSRIHCEGMHHRRDIGAKAARYMEQG